MARLGRRRQEVAALVELAPCLISQLAVTPNSLLRRVKQELIGGEARQGNQGEGASVPSEWQRPMSRSLDSSGLETGSSMCEDRPSPSRACPSSDWQREALTQENQKDGSVKVDQ